MNTDKTELKAGLPARGGLHGFLAAKRRKRRKEKEKGRGRDVIAAAWEREREHRRRPVVPLEQESVLRHLFRCVCCGRLRQDERRREPRSQVCVFCVEEAGVNY
jgi:hypothetical protein